MANYPEAGAHPLAISVGNLKRLWVLITEWVEQTSLTEM